MPPAEVDNAPPTAGGHVQAVAGGMSGRERVKETPAAATGAVPVRSGAVA